HRDAVHAIHSPGQADPESGSGLVGEHPAEAAHHGPLAGANLLHAGQEIRPDQQDAQHHKGPAQHYSPPFLSGAALPAAGGGEGAGEVGFGGLNRTSNSSPWLDNSSMVLLSPRIR